MHPCTQPVVLGGGSWGTALAHVLACATGRTVQLLARDPDVVHAINTRHENPRYLSAIPLHPGVMATQDRAVLRQADLLVLGIPCQTLHGVLCELEPLLAPGIVLINAAKGIELESLRTPRHIVASVAPRLAAAYATLSGPSFAREVAQSKPTAVVLGCVDPALGAQLRTLFATSWFRAYSSTDVLGVELGGSVKNVMAVAAGLSDGLNFGANARAALISRGLAEMVRLGLALGAQPVTLSGLSGLGDLVLTCTGDLSRNRQVGLRLGQGEPLDAITSSLGSVAEGVKTTGSLFELARRHKIDMPIVNAVHAVLFEGCPVMDVVRNLFERSLKAE